MTAIVYDGYTLAADSRMSANTMIITDDAVKLCTPDGKYRNERVLAVGVSGSATALQGMADWINSGADTTKYEQLVGEWEANSIVVTDENCWYVAANGKPIRITGHIAVGSGGMMATAAMKMGKSAVEACEFAIKSDIACGGKVRFIRCKNGNGLPLAASETPFIEVVGEEG